MPEEKGELGYDDPHKLCQGKKGSDIEVKGDLGVRKPFSPEVVMIEKIIELPPILDGIDYGTFPVHPLELFFHVFVKTDPLKEPVQKPTQEKPRFMIEYIRVTGFFLDVIHAFLITPHHVFKKG
jgi:hypothetical protein